MRNRTLWLIAVILCLVSVSMYLPALGNDFVNWDDSDYVYDNPNMKAPDIDFVSWAFSTSRAGSWHPLTWLSLSIDYALWGLNPMGYHLTSVLLHGLNTLLVVLLAGSLFMKGMPSRKGGILFGASVVGVIFGLHPLHVESVAWISERKDMLYALFWLLSLLAYLGYTSSTLIKRRAFYFLLSFISFTLSITGKPMAVTLPFVLLLLDFYPLKRLDQKGSFIRVALLEKLPFYLTSFVVSLMTIMTQKKIGAMDTMEYLSLWKRLLGAIKALGFYAAKTVWPVDLVPFYPLDFNISLFTWEIMLSLIFILSVTAVSVKIRRSIPLFITAWLYYVVTLLPVLGIIQVGSQAAADRYMYLPIGGFIMIVGVLGAIAWEKGKPYRYLFIALFFAVSVVISALTVKQIAVWKDSVSLWKYVIRKEPGVALAHNNLGLAYIKQDRTDDAVKAFLKAIQIDPGHFKAHNNLGTIYGQVGRTDDAIKAFLKAIQINPDHFDVHYNLGIIYFEQGRTDDAIQEFLKAIQINPDFQEGHYDLGVAYRMQGRFKEAAREFQTVLNLNPNDAGARENLESLLRMKK